MMLETPVLPARLMIPNLIDVVIPMHNGAKTIQRALASVCAQIMAPSRIIVVDDGSIDDGNKVIREFPLIETIVTPHLGVSHARNTGIRASTAQYIAFLDCDDVWLLEKLEKQLAVFEKNPQAAAVNTAYIHVDVHGVEVKGLAYPLAVRGRSQIELLRLFDRSGCGSSSMMVRRQALLDAGGFDESLRFGEDSDMWLRLAHQQEFDFCPDVLSKIYENPASTTRRVVDDPAIRSEMLLQHLRVMEKWIGVAPLPALFYVHCCADILVQAVRDQMNYGALVKFRVQMEKRVPLPAARIAPDHRRFLLNIVLSGSLLAYPIFRRFIRYRRRIKCLPRLGEAHALVTSR